MVEIGENAPDFDLHDGSRNVVTGRQHKGQRVVLAFFPGAFTGVCNTMACTLDDRSKDFSSLNAKVLAISVDSIFSQQVWKQQNNMSYTVLSDYNREVIKSYDVIWENLAALEGYNTANRAVFIINAQGEVSYAWIAPNPGVEPDYDEIVATLGTLN